MSSDEICPNFVGCSGGFRREDNKKSLTNPAKSGTLITKQYTIEIVGKGGDRNAGTANVHVHDVRFCSFFCNTAVTGLLCCKRAVFVMRRDAVQMESERKAGLLSAFILKHGGIRFGTGCYCANPKPEQDVPRARGYGCGA